MTEVRELGPLPPDHLVLTPDNRFAGAGYVYRPLGEVLTQHEVIFNTVKDKPLDPFKYKKPIEDGTNPFLSPVRFVEDTQPRQGYYPIAHIKQSLRPPNHLYEIDDAFFAAVNTGSDEQPKWETRYFPKNSLDPRTWKQAMKILKVDEGREGRRI